MVREVGRILWKHRERNIYLSWVGWWGAAGGWVEVVGKGKLLKTIHFILNDEVGMARHGRGHRVPWVESRAEAAVWGQKHGSSDCSSLCLGYGEVVRDGSCGCRGGRSWRTRADALDGIWAELEDLKCCHC